MTENKRFTIKRKDLKYAKILENGKDLTGYFFIAQAKFICDKWNELAEENEDLKKEIVLLKVELDTHKHPLWSTREAERIINELKDENEMLNKKLHEISWNQYVNGGW